MASSFLAQSCEEPQASIPIKHFPRFLKKSRNSALLADLDVYKRQGQGRPLGDVIFVYEETRKVDTNAFFADEGKVLVLNKNEDVIDELHPQRQTYKSNGMEMTAAGISHGFFRDFYVSMGNRLSSDEFLVRLSIRPLVSWIWIGGLIMLLSAVFSSAWRRKEWSQS